MRMANSLLKDKPVDIDQLAKELLRLSRVEISTRTLETQSELRRVNLLKATRDLDSAKEEIAKKTRELGDLGAKQLHTLSLLNEARSNVARLTAEAAVAMDQAQTSMKALRKLVTLLAEAARGMGPEQHELRSRINRLFAPMEGGD